MALKAYKPFLSCMGPLSYDLGFFPGLFYLQSMGAWVLSRFVLHLEWWFEISNLLLSSNLLLVMVQRLAGV